MPLFRPLNFYYYYYHYYKKINSDRKATKYHPLINHLHCSYSTVTFAHLSTRAIGIFGTSSESFLSMLTDLQLDDKTKKNALSKTMNIAVRCTYLYLVSSTLYFLSTKQKLGEPQFTYLLKCDPLGIALTIIVTSFLLLFFLFYFLT